VVSTSVSASAAPSSRWPYCNDVRTKARRQGRNYLPWLRGHPGCPPRLRPTVQSP
jgi:hypothetical protein